MDPLDFDSLSLKEKIKRLYEDGTFIVNIRYYGYKVNLYLIYGHYVEVFYNHKRDVIEKIALMDKDHSRQKFYCDQIKLPDNFFAS